MVSGGPDVGITFPGTVTDSTGTTLHLRVVEDAGGSNPTASPAHSLGVDDPGNFNTITAGTTVTLGLTAPVNAFGLSFITPDGLLDGDIRLAVGGGLAALAVNDRVLLGNFGGADYYAYFLGVVDGAGFNSASIQYDPALSGGEFLFNADDLTVVAVPEPGTPVLFAAGLLALMFGGCRRLAPSGSKPQNLMLSKERRS